MEALTVRTGGMADLPFMVDLGRKSFDAIGFIPTSRYERIIKGEGRSTIHIAEANGDPVGFIYATHSSTGTKIQQCVVQEDARRLKHAKALVSAASMSADTFIAARCAADLESNAFWRALGFVECGRSIGGNRRGRTIVRYVKTVGGLFVPEWPEVPA